MNKFLLTMIIMMIGYVANAQLSNTSWKGTLNIEGGMDVLFNFSKDTLDVLNAEDNSSLETMTYTVDDSVLTLKKLYGASQCDTTAGRYKYVITNDDQMRLTLLSDKCSSRADAIGVLDLKKED